MNPAFHPFDNDLITGFHWIVWLPISGSQTLWKILGVEKKKGKVLIKQKLNPESEIGTSKCRFKKHSKKLVQPLGLIFFVQIKVSMQVVPAASNSRRAISTPSRRRIIIYETARRFTKQYIHHGIELQWKVRRQP